MKHTEILLLQLIKNNGDVENLINLGYEYYQIANMIDSQVKDKNVIINEKGLQLTEEGNQKLIEYNRSLGRGYSEALISPLKEYELDKKIGIYEVFLPNSSNELK